MRRGLSFAILLGLVVLFALPSQAQVLTFTREQLIKFNEKNPFERFPDGRPKVPDQILGKVKELSAEEAWGVLSAAKYQNQFTGGFRLLHPGKKLVGRVVTAQFMPLHPDVADADTKAKGMTKANNQRVIDLLQLNDVLVVVFSERLRAALLLATTWPRPSSRPPKPDLSWTGRFATWKVFILWIWPLTSEASTLLPS